MDNKSKDKSKEDKVKVDNKNKDSKSNDSKTKIDTKKKKGAKKNKKKLRLRLWVWILIITIFVGGALWGGFHIMKWNKDNSELDDEMEQIDDIAPVEDIPVDLNQEELVNAPSGEDKSSDYWKYINLPLMSVDFTELLKKNSDTKAFIRVEGTNINYPVVQAKDNDFYLNHSFNKARNGGGWVFLDYRNNIDDLDDNTIIYAHGRKNNTMFGSLKNILSSDWYTNTDNYVIHLTTPNKSMLWQVFSVYKIPTETYYLTSQFGTEESHQRFIDTIVSRSAFNFNADVNTSDKILTLSTCYNDEIKVVLHAKLIKQA